MPRLQLADLLKRRKMSLLQFVTEHAITTYEGLCARCEWMGVSPPTDEQYGELVPSQRVVNSPQEGVVVVEAPVVIDEMSGKAIDPEAPVVPGVSVVTDGRQEFIDMAKRVGELETSVLASREPLPEPAALTQKRSRKKKDVPPVA